ncbi:MAG: CARDB domain-containing protein, partial [Actinomycetota bacterium]
MVVPDGLASGESYTTTATVNLPIGIDGRQYVHVFTDRNPAEEDRWSMIDTPGRGEFPDWPEDFEARIWEGGTTGKLNNTQSAEFTAIYAEPDLEITQVVVPAEADSGQFINLSWTVTNTGTRATRTDYWVDRIYISKDETLDRYDLMVAEVAHRGTLLPDKTRQMLEPGQSYTVETTIRLPDDIEGDFFLLVYVDSVYAPAERLRSALPYPEARGAFRIDPPRIPTEWNLMGQVKEFADEANNILAQPIGVTQTITPDLRVTAVTSAAIEPDDEVYSGRRFQVDYTVTNTGTNDVPDRQNVWTDYIFLSRDQYLDVNSDHYVGSYRHDGALASGESYSVSRNINVPRGLLGPYYVFVLTDVSGPTRPYGTVYEGNQEGNNASSTDIPMVIYPAPPTDLLVASIDVPADAKVGEEFTFTYTVTNVDSKETARGFWADSFYLSSDAVWDLGDPLISRMEQGEDWDEENERWKRSKVLAPGQSYTNTVTATLPMALPGNYRVIVRTDIFDDIYEGANTVNNRLASTGQAAVEVPMLQLNEPLESTISTGQARLIGIQVPAGETLEVKLTSADKAAANELYVRYEGLPNSIYHDARFETHLWADQVARVPLTEEGTFYIMVRSVSSPTDTPITVEARLLPFSIREIRPDRGGDDRYVTVDIRGARFDPNALVKLVRPQFAEFSPVNYEVVNATRIVATFDLRAAPHGLYDMHITNADGSVVVAPYRYLIEEALPLDLTVGMGGPSELEYGDVGWYGLGVLSLTNVDTPYVHFEFGLPRLPQRESDTGYAEYVREEMEDPEFPIGDPLIFRTNLQGAPGVDGVPWLDLDSVLNLDGRQMAPGFTFDFINRGYMALTFTADVYSEMRNVMEKNPDALKELRDRDTLGMPPPTYQSFAYRFFIAAAATPMTAQEYIDYQLGVAARLRVAILDDPGAPRALIEAAADPDSWGLMYLAGLREAGQLREEDTPPEIHLIPPVASQLALATAGLLGIESGQEIAAGRGWAAFFAQVRAWYGHDDTQYHAYEVLPGSEDFDLGLSHETHFEAFWVQAGIGVDRQVIRVDDPRLTDYFGLTGEQSELVRMTGPTGYGAENFVPMRTYLPYSVSFEQRGDATEAVNQVRILQELDETLDERSFMLGDIILGDMRISVPDGMGSFSGDFDLVEDRGIVLRVTAGVDVVTRTAFWTLTALDPETGLPPADDRLGVLLPNTDRSQTGSVSYFIRSWPDYTLGVELDTGTSIDASARVIFDGGIPMDTNIQRSTLDALPPTTVMTVDELSEGVYQIRFEATDDAGGSGVKDSTVYLSIDGGPWQVWQRRTLENDFIYTAPTGSTAEFLVLSADHAGNVEAAPDGVILPSYNPGLNLGVAPSETQLAAPFRPTVAEPVYAEVTNPLFLQALLGVPIAAPVGLPTAFNTVFEPFTAASFARGIPGSGADIGPLGVAVHSDGRVFISGGEGRNLIWVFGQGGGVAGDPMANLDVPVYAMVFDSLDRLWATTGGGSLLRIDPDSGTILSRHGAGVQLGLAVHPETGKLYVSTARGIEVFDPDTKRFSGFSSTRVHSLAFGPDAVLHGTLWPNDGHVVRFDSRGNREIVMMADPDHKATGLAFGEPGTALEDLLFVQHESGGFLTMVDLATFERIAVATGGGRGEFMAVGPGGRLYITQPDQVDVFRPLSAPIVIASNPVEGADRGARLNEAVIRFDMDMLDEGANRDGSINNLSYFRITNLRTGQNFPVLGAAYDSGTQTVRLLFEPLASDTYELRINAGLRSALHVAMTEDTAVSFSVAADMTDAVQPVYSETRFDRETGIVSFDVSITNNSGYALLEPLRLEFRGLAGDAGATLLDASGVTSEGYPYFDLTPASGELPNGESLATFTVRIHNPNQLHLDLDIRLTGKLPPNQPPSFTSTPGDSATVGEEFLYESAATDSDGETLRYLFAVAPEGAVVDPDTGVVRWTPTQGSGSSETFALRTYDPRGGYAEQTWVVSVGGVNQPPVLLPIANFVIAEGERLEVPVSATDPEGDTLVFWVSNLPAGATFDADAKVIAYTPDADAAGRYGNIEVFVSDGTSMVSRVFEILVTNVNQ